MEEFIEFLKEKHFSIEEMELLVIPFGMLPKEDRKAFLQECRDNPELIYEMKHVFEKQRQGMKGFKKNDSFRIIEEGAEQLAHVLEEK
jgi:hypothetical protein